MKDWLEGKPIKTTPIRLPSFNEEYELALKVGRERFGSPCKHINTRGGVCLDCCRKVIARLGE